MSRRGVVGGTKMSTRHQTYVPGAERVIVTAKSMPEVNKVVLGPIKPARNGRAVVKCSCVPVGLRLMVRSPRGCQILFVHTKEPSKIANALGLTLETTE